MKMFSDLGEEKGPFFYRVRIYDYTTERVRVKDTKEKKRKKGKQKKR
jgi:hypothetical protein